MRCLILMLALVGAAVAQSVDSLRKSFDERCELAATSRDEQLEKLGKSYQGALERMLEKIKSAGKLDAVLPVHQELEAIKQGTDPLPPLADSATSELKQLRTKYEDSRHQILKAHATTLAGLAEKMETALKAREADLTKAGKIDDAVAARQSREELAQDADIRAARDLLTQGGAGGKGRAAMQLRRYGDNLEVLVFYDRLGRVSMDSPIENVREKTGEGKELGDTKAKTLGEFVGAKGYTVDPYVSFDQTFDRKDIEDFGLVELVPEYRFEVENQRGLRLACKSGAKTPMGNIRASLPPAESKGTYRISIRYYLPDSNRLMVGFRMGNEAGHTAGERKLLEKGKWVDDVIVGESTCDKPNLILYLIFADQKTSADDKGDFLVLGRLKVEHIQFTCFVQQRFGDSGKPEQEQKDPLKQPVFIINGEFAKR